MRDRLSLFLLLLSAVAATRHVPARRSCRDHYLAGHDENGVYPIRFHKTHANVACRMPYSGSPQAVVTSVIRSALERGIQVTDARTVQWQLDDFTILRDVLERSTSCKQTIHVNRTARPEGQTRSPLPEPGIMLHSILGEQTYISGDQETGSIELHGRAAGILHIVPDELENELNPYIVATELVCDEFVRKYEECLIDGGVLIDTSTSSREHFRFAFRTDASNQPLLTAYHEGGARTVVELSDDFFLQLDDGTKPIMVGHVSDGKWHTAQIARDGTHLSLDGGLKIELPFHGPVKQVAIRINGWIMLTDPMDEAEGCADNKRINRDPQPSHTRPFCAGATPCECTMLDDHFRFLPSTTCLHEEGAASEFTLARHPDLLSFLMLPDSLSSSNSIALSMTFKSDSDSGLLLFGEWRNSTWGRVQVHYHGENLTAAYCTQQDENSIEICRGCLIERKNGYGTDTWTRVTTFADRDGQLFLTVDSEICQLDLPKNGEDYDTAEMYKTVLTRGSVLFVGGMFNKKVKSGIYRDEFKAKFFENTREKLPSLRGCVKDVFARGEKVDVLKAFETQWRTTLISPAAEKYAVRMGCGTCPTQCPLNSRCRPVSNELYAESTCDCADVEMYMENGACRKQSTAPLSLDKNSPFAYRSEFVVHRRGVLSKIWIKLKLPTHPMAVDTPIITFNSHGSVMFQLYLMPDGKLAVKVNPENSVIDAPNASKFLDPSDDRIHLVTFEKRTPLGTHPSRRFYDLCIDGQCVSIPDPSMTLTTIEFGLIESPQGEAGCVSDLGLSFDFDEHRPISEDNQIETINVLQLMTAHGAVPSHENTCGVLDPLLWTRGAAPNSQLGPLGRLIDHKPDGFEGQTGGASSVSWFLYSIILTIILALLLLLCIIVYLCCLRTKRRKDSMDDQERMLRDSPDYPVTFRKTTFGGDDSSLVSDSIDNTDFSMYAEPKLHRVIVDRESMISFVEPTSERQVHEAQIVERGPTPNTAPICRDDQSDL